ncbi:BOS complex subunit NCLN isoform X1 [Stomoxys calcitrans]|uniref:BOS complex subunit NCLN isoform X1 n=1 Tax=Stomoxys calcitrans TaxID=35570 RepID=UPI0027E2CE1D|nr:BOS complex subunit NCLN isoform X1 [Stomoxys calcitrans]
MALFEDADNFADIFRGGLPYYLLLALPILIICSANPVLASSEFTVQRMSQFDVNGVSYGCRASALSLEAKSLYTWSTSRHCVVAKFQDVTIDQFKEIRQKAGGLVLLLPQNISSMNSEDKEHLNLLEQAMMSQSISVPVYFSEHNNELEKIVNDISRNAASSNKQKNARSDSALNEVFNSISANGYQIIVTGASHANNKNSKISIVQGELAPTKLNKANEEQLNSKLPLIIVAGHLNTFGLYNESPLNADAAVLMALADLFSKMHNTPNAAPKYRLLFLLSESGPLLNFQGVKKWLDENVQLQYDDIFSITGSIIIRGNHTDILEENVDFVLCLDTVTQALNADEDHQLFMHVSKPPKENTPTNAFFKHLKKAGQKYRNVTIEGVHKKINLADQQLAWQHERFSIKRLSAFTLSSLKSPKHPTRTTIFKDNEEEILERAQLKAKIIAEALARYIYGDNANAEGSDDLEVFAGTMQISPKLIKSYLNLQSALNNNDLKNAFEKYLKNVKLIYEKPDAREPDFMLYEGAYATLNVYRVKPAVFDLFLTILICAYLFSVYFVIQYFPNMYQVFCKLSLQTPESSPTHYNHIERNKSKTN